MSPNSKQSGRSVVNEFQKRGLGRRLIARRSCFFFPTIEKLEPRLCFSGFEHTTGNAWVESLSSPSTAEQVAFANQSAAFLVEPIGTNSPETLVSALLAPGSGISIVGGSVAYVGASLQSGTYQNFLFTDSNAGIELALGDGVILTTGSAISAIDNNNRPDTLGVSGDASLGTNSGPDADLAGIVGNQTFDRSSLSFEFTVPANATGIRFDLVFATEEFPDFVQDGYNDVAAVYLDGTQIAADASGKVFSVDNSFFLLNNSGLVDSSIVETVGKTPVDFSGFEYDGITNQVTTTAPLTASVTTHRLRIVIADSGDDALDSALFIANLRVTTDAISGPSTGGSISGEAFEDLNSDGVRQPGEALLPGQTVYIDSNGNAALDPGEVSAVTSATGAYIIESIPPGDTLVRVVVPLGFSQTIPSGQHAVTLTAGQDVTDRNFGIVGSAAATSTISGTKFDDVNGNGVRDGGLVTGTDPDVVFIIDVSGSTSSPFQGTPVGDLNNDGNLDTILDAEIAGFIELNKNLVARGLGQVADVSVVAFSDNASAIDLDPITVGTQTTTKAGADKNSNGLLDVEEALRGLRDGGGTDFESALSEAIAVLQSLGTTPENGNIIFLSDGSPGNPGAHTDETGALRSLANNVRAFGVGSGASLPQLQIIDPAAVAFTTTNELLTAFQGVGSGTGPTIVFADAGVAGVTIYLDLNENGIFDIGEPSTVTRSDDPLTATINEAGTYRFSNLAPSTYTVREVIPPGFTQTRPIGPLNGYRIVIGAGTVSENNDFGNTRTAATNSVSGYVYADVDNDGNRFVTVGGRQLTQTGLPNITVQLTNTATGLTLETLTDALGFYEFLAVPNGTYNLQQIQPIIFVDGKESEGLPKLSVLGGTIGQDVFQSLVLTGGVIASEYNFGERGLKAQYVTKSLLLSSTPSGSDLAAQYDTNARFKINADTSGVLSISNLPPNTTAQLYSLTLVALPISLSQTALNYSIAEGESVILVVETLTPATTPRSFNVSLKKGEKAASNRAGAFTNAFLNEDVNGDGQTTPLDALLIINKLNEGYIGEIREKLSTFVDVDRDGMLTPLDALLVINRLNEAATRAVASSMLDIPEVEQNNRIDAFFTQLSDSLDMDSVLKNKRRFRTT